MVKKFLLSCFFINLCFFCPAQMKLTNYNATWSKVIDGKVVSRPTKYSSGFYALTDGRTLSKIDFSGKTIWEKKFSNPSSTLLFSVQENFLIAVTNSKGKIAFLNPDGYKIWEKNVDFEISDEIFEGRDGRFFLRGKERILCFGLNGICKYELKTEPQSKIPLLEMPDGSLLVFLKNLSENKSRAIRISPFGKILEEITFAGEVYSAEQSSGGVFVSFTDGSAGLFSVLNGKAINRYVIERKKKSTRQNIFVAGKETDASFFLCQDGKNVTAFKIDPNTGEELLSFQIADINLSEITAKKMTDAGFFICDKKRAYFFNLYGVELFSATILENKGKSKWNYNFFENGEIIFCMENWTLNAYSVIQSIQKEKPKKNENKNYKNFINSDSSVYQNGSITSFDKTLASTNRILELENGFYGEKEANYYAEVESAVEAYISEKTISNFGTRMGKSIFQVESSGFEKILSQLQLFSSYDFTHYAAKILKLETNTALLNVIFLGIAKNGFDPDGELLLELENLSTKTLQRNDTFYINLCNAVDSICKFMGYTSFENIGRQILSNFLYPKYSADVRAKARDTLKSLADFYKS